MRILVATTCSEKIELAKACAKSLSLQFLSSIISHNFEADDYLLLFTTDFIGIQKPTEKKTSPFYINFASSKMLYRLKKAGLRNELLARAIGGKPNHSPKIIDATAGLGRDSFLLASLGFKITLIERSPILHLLLEDALFRAQKIPVLAPIATRLTLIHANSIHYLSQINGSQYPDVIYIDPMFPMRQKSALVKKDMVLLQSLVGKDIDANALFKIAVTCAKKRVVVKRAKLAGIIADSEPNFSISGNKNRFDIYLA